VRADRREDQRRRRADPEQNERMLAKLRHKYATNTEFRLRQIANAKAIRRVMVGRDLSIQARTRSNRNGREFALVHDDVQAVWEASPHCEYCGVKLEAGEKKFNNNSPSLDRIDTSRGYTPDNVAFACFRCNTLKRDASVEELEALVVNIKRVMAEAKAAIK
jgi:hypothetical protein